MVAQIILTAVCSLVVAYTVVLPIVHPLLLSNSDDDYHDDDDKTPTTVPLLFQNNTLVLTCLIASLWHLTQTALTYPELNPLSLRRGSGEGGGGARFHWRSPFSTTPVDRLMVLSILVVGMAFLATTTTTMSSSSSNTAHPTNRNDGDATAWGLLVVCSLAAGSGIYMYLDLFDQFIQYMICNYGKDIHQVVWEAMDDPSHNVLLQVAVESLAHSDHSLLRSLLEPSTRAYADLERHEVQRYQQACQAMAQRLLQSESSQHERPAPLEEDVLRIVLLAHYGAGRDLQDTSSLTMKHILQWIHPSPDHSVGGEPLVVPLVRAISVYIGGLGESLFTCCSHKVQPVNPNKQESQSLSPHFPWVLAPGTIACATYAVRAGTRFLLTNGQELRPVGRLTMLHPVFLSALHHLESSMVQWVGHSSRVLGVTSSSRTAREMFQREYPQLWPIYQAISEASTTLLAALPPRTGGTFQRHLSPDCSRWVEEILYSMIPPPAVVPPTIGY